MRYKVGDKVKVRTDLIVNDVYESENNAEDEAFIVDMTDFKGKTVTISKVLEDDGCYHIEEDGSEWYWTASMFESVEEDKAHKLAEILGLKVGEEFKVDGYKCTFKITDKGLVYADDNTVEPNVLHELLFEDAKIIKCTYKPKKGDEYFRVIGEDKLFSSLWEDDVIDYGNFYTGNCFRSEEEARKQSHSMMEKLHNYYKNA